MYTRKLVVSMFLRRSDANYHSSNLEHRNALKLKLNIWDGKTIDKDTDPESHTIYCKRKIESKHNQ